MNAFEIFRLDGKPWKTVQSLDFGVYFPHDIFDEARLSIRLFSNELFILSLEQREQFARPDSSTIRIRSSNQKKRPQRDL